MSNQVFTFCLRLLDREQGIYVVLAEITSIRCCEVYLIVVCACHAAIQVVAVVQRHCAEVVFIHIVVNNVVSGRSVQVVATAKAPVHLVEGECRTILVALIGVDALRVRETQVKSFENFAPSEVIFNASANIHVRCHVALIVAVVLQYAEVVVLVLIFLSVARSVCCDVIVANAFGHILRTCQQQVVVFLITRASHFYKRGVLLAVVAAYCQVCLKPFANLHVNTGAVVPTVIIQSAEVTILLKV